MTTDATTISPENESVTLKIIGTDDVVFVPNDAPNQDVCGAGCNLGPKPFFVAGGKVNIRGFPLDSSCATHTPILDKIYSSDNEGKSRYEIFLRLSIVHFND